MRLRLAVLLCVLAAGPARAQMDSREAIALQNQIAELRRDVQSLRDQVSRASQGGAGGSFLGLGGGSRPPAGPPNEITAQLLDRVQVLEDEVRRLRGRLDEVANQTQTQGADLGKQLGDLNFRVQTLEGGGTRPPSAPNAPAPTAAPTAPGPPPTTLGTIPALPPAGPGPAPPRTPEMLMQEGNAALARRDYPAAEGAARQVLASGRATPRAYDAQFLLAQALAGKRDYTQAAIAYDDTYGRSRTGTHAPDALLGLGTSLSAIGEKKAACETLDRFRAEFPNARQNLRDEANAARLRAGCR